MRVNRSKSCHAINNMKQHGCKQGCKSPFLEQVLVSNGALTTAGSSSRCNAAGCSLPCCVHVAGLGRHLNCRRIHMSQQGLYQQGLSRLLTAHDLSLPWRIGRFTSQSPSPPHHPLLPCHRPPVAYGVIIGVKQAGQAGHEPAGGPRRQVQSVRHLQHVAAQPTAGGWQNPAAKAI